jgi:phospholipid/cholesterol/gamma-HCH transport system substrate-binding protein
VNHSPIGATVKFRGIPIGKVQTIAYDPTNLSRVKVFYSIDAEFPMKRDMCAQTGMMGITGLKYVEILGGTNTALPLKENEELPAKQSLMASITGKSEVIIGKIELLLNQLNILTNPDSLLTLRKILANVESITSTGTDFVNSLTPDIKDIAVTLKKTIRTVDSISSDIRTVTKSIHDSISPGTVMKIVLKIDSTASELKNLSQSLNMAVLQSKEDFTVSMENLRETVENINELSKLLLENPSLIIKGENPKPRRNK